MKILSMGEGTQVDLAAVVQVLRQEHGIRTLLCEGGPTLYGEVLKHQLIDEDFRTMSLQVLGESTKPAPADVTVSAISRESVAAPGDAEFASPA